MSVYFVFGFWNVQGLTFELYQPANVLMDDAGHIRISDLGLATDCSKKLPNENW